jgi:ribonuclease P protein component
MRLTRLTVRSDFLAATARGRRHRAASFTAQVLHRDGAAAPDPAEHVDQASALRLGLTASRRVGNAPVRNRIRRRLRAAAALALVDAAAKPVDVVLVARREVLGTPFLQLIADIAAALAQAGKPRPNLHRNDSAP